MKKKTPWQGGGVGRNHDFVGAAYMRPVAGRQKNQGRMYATPTKPANPPTVIPAINTDRGGRDCPESIFAFAFSPSRSDVSTLGQGGLESNTKTKGEFSAFRIRTPRDNKVVVTPPGEKSKWIPAFAGTTNNAESHP